MPLFTIERTYLLPVFQHLTFEAETAEDAMRQALDHDAWESAEKDYDNSRAVYISGAWEGEEDYVGDCLPIPTQFQEDQGK